MNITILMGRPTRDPEIRYSQGENATVIARYTLAVPRLFQKGEEAATDFINCVAFGKAAEFAEKYLVKGIKIIVKGRIQTGSYINKEGITVHTTSVVVESQEFAESKSHSGNNSEEGFVNIPDGSLDGELPFN